MSVDEEKQARADRLRPLILQAFRGLPCPEAGRKWVARRTGKEEPDLADWIADMLVTDGSLSVTLRDEEVVAVAERMIALEHAVTSIAMPNREPRSGQQARQAVGEAVQVAQEALLRLYGTEWPYEPRTRRLKKMQDAARAAQKGAA